MKSDSSSNAAAAPRGCSHFKLRQLARRVGQHYDQIVASAGVKTSQYSLLTHLVGLGPVRPGELARELDMDASTLTRNLQPLVAQGWVEIGAGDDGRSRRVTITAAGRTKRAEAQREWKRAQIAFNERLGDATVTRLHAMVDECMALLRDEALAGDAVQPTKPGVKTPSKPAVEAASVKRDQHSSGRARSRSPVR